MLYHVQWNDENFPRDVAIRDAARCILRSWRAFTNSARRWSDSSALLWSPAASAARIIRSYLAVVRDSQARRKTTTAPRGI